tara:strand:+ start:1360 stop:1569 length:210 start_codon:yes stop_codon:yes gene_type:complete
MRENIEEVDVLLEENAKMNATLGKDSTLEEREKVRWHIIRNINKIKDLCLVTYNIIKVDDNHKKQNELC